MGRALEVVQVGDASLTAAPRAYLLQNYLKRYLDYYYGFTW